MSFGISSYQTGAQIALKLLGSGGADGQGALVSGSQGMTKAGAEATAPESASKLVLSATAAREYFGAGSEIARAVSGLGDSVQISYSGLDVPQDKEAFRQKALAYLKSAEAGYDARYPEHAEFLQKLKEGKVIVQTVDETPELNWQPDVGWAVYRDGYPQGGGITSQPIGDQALFDAQEATRSQHVGSIGGQYFYAYYER
ncbi:hypothetical protein LCM17_00330 [Cereibacter sphaeroides]|nr:hypothetical protein [Cereibacter sphaeroides]